MEISFQKRSSRERGFVIRGSPEVVHATSVSLVSAMQARASLFPSLSLSLFFHRKLFRVLFPAASASETVCRRVYFRPVADERVTVDGNPATPHSPSVLKDPFNYGATVGRPIFQDFFALSSTCSSPLSRRVLNKDHDCNFHN